MYPRRDSNSHVLTDTGFLDRGVYHSTTWALPFRVLKSAIWHFLFCTPHRIRTDTCTGFKSVASANWATGAYKIKKPELFTVRVCLILDILFHHHEINPNLAQPEPAVLIHNVLFTTIVRFKFVIFRFIVLILLYIKKFLSLLLFFTNIGWIFYTTKFLFVFFSNYLCLYFHEDLRIFFNFMS